MSSDHEASRVIFLADDDEDDCMLFEEALREVSQNIQLTTAKDGGHLMRILDQTVPPAPDVIFLDLNMPSKNGFECLDEIKVTPKLKNIPVVIFSTSANPETIDKVYEKGANFYICKPGTFFLLKKAILHVLNMDWATTNMHPPKEKFILQLN
jgi:CheY-like chemotaxis protein